MSDSANNTITVCPVAELGPGEVRVVEHEGDPIAVFNCDGEFFAIEDRCSHDDGPLADGNLDQADCLVECPRHGSLFDLKTGKPKTLPAFQPVRTFSVSVSNDEVILEV